MVFPLPRIHTSILVLNSLTLRELHFNAESWLFLCSMAIKLLDRNLVIFKLLSVHSHLKVYVGMSTMLGRETWVRCFWTKWLWDFSKLPKALCICLCYSPPDVKTPLPLVKGLLRGSSLWSHFPLETLLTSHCA